MLALDTLYINAVALVIVLGLQLRSGLLYEAALIIAMLCFITTGALARFVARATSSNRRPAMNPVNLHPLVEAAVAALLVIGGVSSFSSARSASCVSRLLHATARADQGEHLGVGGVLLASLLWQRGQGEPSARELLFSLFLFVTAPVSAHHQLAHRRARSTAALPPAIDRD